VESLALLLKWLDQAMKSLLESPRRCWSHRSGCGAGAKDGCHQTQNQDATNYYLFHWLPLFTFKISALSPGPQQARQLILWKKR